MSEAEVITESENLSDEPWLLIADWPVAAASNPLGSRPRHDPRRGLECILWVTATSQE